MLQLTISHSQDYAVTVFASQSMNSNLRCVARGEAIVISELRDVFSKGCDHVTSLSNISRHTKFLSVYVYIYIYLYNT